MHFMLILGWIDSLIRFADKQIVRLQETPDEIPEGGTPHTVSLLLHDKLVDLGKPGDRVEVRLHHRTILFHTPRSLLNCGSLFYNRSLEFIGL